MESTRQEQTKEEAIRRLREIFGLSACIIADRLSNGAEYKVFKLYISGDGMVNRLHHDDLTFLVSKVTGFRFDKKRGGIGIGGQFTTEEAVAQIVSRLAGKTGVGLTFRIV